MTQEGPGGRPPVRKAALAAQRGRFAVWARRLDWALRRAGGRLELHAPHGAHFYALPAVEILPEGGPGGVLALRLGRDVKLGRLLTLEVHAGARNVLELEDRATFQTACRVQLHGGRIARVAGVQARDFVQLKCRNGGELRVGEFAVLSRDAILHASERVDLGPHVGLGERSSIIDSDHTLDGSDEPFLHRPLRTAPIVVGRNAAISANCVLLRGVHLGANAALAAGSVARAGELQAGWMHAGAPARPVRALGG